MTHVYRFFARISDGVWTIEGEEFKHLNKVLRLKSGDAVEVANGEGIWASGVLNEISSGMVTVHADEEIKKKKRESQIVSLGLGALKPGSIDEVLPSLIEIGVDRILVYGQDEMAKFRISDKATERWRRISISSLKQCKRSWLPKVIVYKNLDDLISAEGATEAKYVFKQTSQSAQIGSEQIKEPSAILGIVGGEKGFSAREEQILSDAGFNSQSLGDQVLRAYTAAIVGAYALCSSRS